MQVVVCCKQIPDPAGQYELDPDTHWLIRPSEQILDDTDRYGVEMGLQLAQAKGGTVTLVSMGPSGNMQGIRQALAMGVDGAVIIDDPGLKGSDGLVTARVLAAAISRTGFDLVICGTESTDGYSGLIPQMVAELLEVPSLTFATKVTVEGKRIGIHRQTATGYDQVEADLPALISVTAGVVEPRYPTFKGIMEAKKKPVQTFTAADLGLEVGAGQKMVSIVAAQSRTSGQKIEDDGESYLRIVELLEQRKVI
jgi:electron transfer flavoprotein beta subunit